MNLVYRTLKPLVTFCTRRFFSTVVVTGAVPVEKGPLLIVANHPNVMLDALLVVNTYRRVLWFLVKSTAFRGAVVARIFNAINLVPIHRPVDAPEETAKNSETFRLVAKKLRDGEAVLIFPEGQSMAERRILPIKTGAARIAFQAEVESGFELGLQIQPVGITYSDLFRYNSSVTVVLGEPLRVAQFRERYLNDSRQAVRDLSDEIAKRLKHITAEVPSSPHTQLVVNIAKLYRSKGLGRDDQSRLREVSRHVERLLPERTDKGSRIAKRIEFYLQLASSLKLDGSETLDGDLDPVFLTLAGPFIVFGVLVHLVPFRLAGKYGAKIAPHKSQLSSWRFVLGMMFFIFWYAFGAIAFYKISRDYVRALLFVVLILTSGYFAHKYFNRFSLFTFAVLWPGRRSPVDVLRNMRDDLIAELEELRLQEGKNLDRS